MLKSEVAELCLTFITGFMATIQDNLHFVGAKFYCPHASLTATTVFRLARRCQGFFSTVLPAWSLYQMLCLCHLRFKHRLTPAPIVFRLTFICIYRFSFNLDFASDIKMLPASGRLCPLSPWAGALLLDPVGGCTSDACYRLALCAHHSFATFEILLSPLHKTVVVVVTHCHL